MILDDLLIENFRLMDLLHQLVDTSLVVNVSITLLLFEFSLLVSQLHLDAFMISSLCLDLLIQMFIASLHLADLLVG